MPPPGGSCDVDLKCPAGDGANVQELVKSRTYHPGGLYDTMRYGNGIKQQQTLDNTSGANRPDSITISSGGTERWGSGTYSYDGAGNIRGYRSGHLPL